MDNSWPDSTLIFDIWDRFERHVVWKIEQLHRGDAVEFCSEELSGVALDVHVAKSLGGQGYAVVVRRPDPHRGSIDRLSEQGWNLRWPGDHVSELDLRIERNCAEPREVAATLSTMLRGSLGMRNPWFMGLAPVYYSSFADSGEPDKGFNPRTPMDRMDLLTSVGISLREAYGSFAPMMMDGVFLVRSPSDALLIRSDQEAANIEFTWTVNSDIRGRGAAKSLARRLNDRSSLAHFSVEDGEVGACYTLPADPFVPAHLYRVINSVGEAIASVLDVGRGGADETSGRTHR